MIGGRGFERWVIVWIDADELQADELVGPIGDLEIDRLNAAASEGDTEVLGGFVRIQNGDGYLGARVGLCLGAIGEGAIRRVGGVWGRYQAPEAMSEVEYHEQILVMVVEDV